MPKLEEQFNDQTLSGTIPVNEQNLLQEFLQTVVLDDLNDVNISSPVNGQVIGYNSVTNSWQNLNASIVDGDKGDITTSAGGNTWTIDNNAVVEAKIGTGAVTETKIADSAVTENKIANNAVTVNKIANDSVTNSKLANMATATVKGRATAGTGDPEDLAIDNDLSTVSANDDTIPSAKAVKAYVDILELKTKVTNAGLLNGYIRATVASNNLTLAISTSASSQVDPTATNPVYVWIGDTLRSITGALSIAANAGTNWFNSGSSELATKEIDYFAYIGYNATDGVVLGYARIPYARLYSDFNTTTTNEKYARISTITNAAAGDNYVNIGRFAATLSAGAGYTWTVPSFTNANLIQEPIYETRWLDWLPDYTQTGGMTFTSVTTTEANYKLFDRYVKINFRLSGTTGGSADTQIEFTVPFTPATVTVNFAGSGFDGGTVGILFRIESGRQLGAQKFTGTTTNWALGASKFVNGTGDYLI